MDVFLGSYETKFGYECGEEQGWYESLDHAASPQGAIWATREKAEEELKKEAVAMVLDAMDAPLAGATWECDHGVPVDRRYGRENWVWRLKWRGATLAVVVIRRVTVE